jgi:CubicO group peptidase (beta-lactamase class C family)
MTTERIDRVLELAGRPQGAAAQVCVLRHGEVVLDQSIGCSREALFVIYSASKPFVALSVHLLAERGMLSLDDPVATYWPEFAQRGKDRVTVRHVLQHRAGIPVTGGYLTTLRHVTDWDDSVRDAERARPRWPAGAVPAYHFLSYGFILGELVRRVPGVPLRDFLASELLVPLGLDDIYLGLPDEQWPRHVVVRAGHPSELGNQFLFNRRSVRQAVIPAATISTTASQLARFYQMLLRGGELNGVRVLAERTVDEARRPSSDGEVDAFIKRPVRWAQGFQLGGPGRDPRDLSQIMGANNSHETFGHAGNVSCNAWADPAQDLVFTYLCSVQPGLTNGVRHLREISDAVRSAYA